jgi:photoactive yellow protein
LEERLSSITTPDSLDRIDIESITDLTSEQLDQKPFGVIGLDQEGTILSYNHYESELTGRQPQNVIGKNFFRDVAPCTNVKAFAGRFREGVARGQLHVTFPYRFDFEMEPRNVVVTLYFSAASGKAWVFVREFKE